MKTIYSVFIAFFTFIFTIAQNGNPTDYLSKEFHKERREALRAKMPKNSVAVLFSNPVRNRANDVDFIYHQDPDFYYLTGLKEPHSVLVVFSENQTNSEGVVYNDILFLQPKDPRAEMWNGRRLGADLAKTKLGFTYTLNTSTFIENTVDFNTFDNIIFHNFKDDYRDGRSAVDLFDLTKNFKTQINFVPKTTSVIVEQVYGVIKATPIENSANVAQNIGSYSTQFPELKKDELINKYMSATTNHVREEAKKEILNIKAETPKYNTKMLGGFMAELREIKTAEEMKLLTKAVQISAIGQIEIMKAMHPGMSEGEIQGVHEYVYKKYGSEYEGYPSIVGAGNNGCVLHYIDNTKTKVANELVLMDLGAEYRGYTADVTRTIPANGKFSKEQRAIYDIVYKSQEAGIAACTVGAPFFKSNQEAQKVINQGLFDLGIIKSLDERHNYLPHGTSHYIGLDVHDPGTYGPLRENSVITVEPGIYIPEGSPCDKKWWTIAVRIEDDILITKNGPVNLSVDAPRKADEIEDLMALPSPLDAFKLPHLD
ncbi:aminopeptidase P N-terminal domain-containing protein [Aurantibacter sp.]|uniref:aminopeptidase P N-terminal domain-containing protein n=1 Tax=Aurantibacter sp. TaxID=2807103 RepID=UPI0035C79F96